MILHALDSSKRAEIAQEKGAASPGWAIREFAFGDRSLPRG